MKLSVRPAYGDFCAFPCDLRDSYHKHRLSKEQLEALVAELQKKVKVLQQRHRRHLDKLLGLENAVSQMVQKNLMTEERLQLLERVGCSLTRSLSYIISHTSTLTFLRTN